MEFVILAHVQLNRIGSATGGGFGSHTQTKVLKEIADEEPDTVRELVLAIAQEHGESRDALTGLSFERVWGRDGRRAVLNIQGRNIFHSQPYAECQIQPALKINDRYFKLEEIAL